MSTQSSGYGNQFGNGAQVNQKYNSYGNQSGYGAPVNQNLNQWGMPGQNRSLTPGWEPTNQQMFDQNLNAGHGAVPGAPAWNGSLLSLYNMTPQYASPSSYGRWNWAKPGMVDQSSGGGTGTGVVGKPPISTTPQPIPQQQSSPPPQWNGVPSTPGDPWVSGSGYSSGIPGTEAPATPGAPIIGNPAGLLGSAGASQRIGGDNWWAAIQAMQNRG